jgi:hypothetical protein
MAYRKSLIQVKFRFREDLLRRLEREAKRGDRSTNDEIARRLEQSLRDQDAAAERAGLVEAIRGQIESMTPQEVGGAIVALVALGGPQLWSPTMAALRTEQGRAAFLESWLAQDEKQKQ